MTAMIRPLIFAGIVLILPVFFLLVFVISTYNKLAALRQRCQSAYDPIDAELKRRSDLVPRFIDAVKAHSGLDPETLKTAIAARNAYSSASIRAARSPGDPAALKGLAASETQLSRALGQLIALIDATPDLKASQAVTTLREELASIDCKVDLARQAYNDLAMDYNTARKSFPAILIAALFQLSAAELLAVEKPAAGGTGAVASS